MESAETNGSIVTESPPTQVRARQEPLKRLDDRVARLDELSEVLDRQRELLSQDNSGLMAGVERWYSTVEAARFFNRTNQWLYVRFRQQKFRYRDGTPIEPIMVGDGPRPRRRYTLPLIREIALSCYRDGTVKYAELQVILQRIIDADTDETLSVPETE